MIQRPPEPGLIGLLDLNPDSHPHSPIYTSMSVLSALSLVLQTQWRMEGSMLQWANTCPQLPNRVQPQPASPAPSLLSSRTRPRSVPGAPGGDSSETLAQHNTTYLYFLAPSADSSITFQERQVISYGLEGAAPR